MTKLEENKKELTNEEKLELAKDFVFTLLQKIPKRKLNDKECHIYIGNENKGTLQEYINDNLSDIWGIKILWED